MATASAASLLTALPGPLPITPPRAITLAEAGRVHALIQSRIPALRHPRQLTRFLCGLSSPATLRDRLTTKHEDYGMLAAVCFEEVLAHCNASI